MRKRFPAMIVSFILILLAGYYFFNLYQLLSKSYYVEEGQLHRVGTFQLLNRAHEQSDYIRRGFSKPKLIFQSKNYYSFAIDRYIFKAIINEKELKDTLMYAGLPFTVYTNQEYFNKYKNSKEPIYIRVFQIEIGGKKYIDISKMNRLTRRNILSEVILWPFIILSFWFALSNKIRYSANRKFIILCVAWVVIMIGLILWT